MGCGASDASVAARPACPPKARALVLGSRPASQSWTEATKIASCRFESAGVLVL